MVFSSMVFLCVFLPVIYLGHLLLPGIRLKNLLLLFGSLLFYAYGEPIYIILMALSAFVNYLLGLGADRYKNHKKLWGALTVSFNLLLLGVFKYAGFLVLSVNSLIGLDCPVPQIALPLGISFFTFQAMSYVLDVVRGINSAQKNFGKVLLYISFFPQLIAGPIVKYHDIEEEISSRSITLEGTVRGIRRFIAGLSKKVLIANVMGLAADSLFGAGVVPNILMAWVGAVSYMLQIYFDFSGYSDMAIGMGWMFGFHFKENFHYPYSADSVRDFWRRWHISLSGWFKEYLYIPLGGNRKGRFRTCVNKIIVFVCTGIWHGANLTFLFWGIYHGFFLMLEEFVPFAKKGEKTTAVKKIALHIYTLLVVCVGFVFFRADTFAQGLRWTAAMFTGFRFDPAVTSLVLLQMTPLYIVTFIAALVACMPLREKLEKQRGYEVVTYGLSIVAFLLCMLNLAGGTYNPFIYFRF